MLFSDGNIYITLSYLITGVLFLALIAHTVWRGRDAKRKIADLTRQQGLSDTRQSEDKSS